MSRHSEALAELLKRPPLPCIAAAAAEHDATVLCVGGAVRDALLGRTPGDVDVAVGGDLDAFVERFKRHCGRTPAAIDDSVRDTRRTRLDGMQVDLGAMVGDTEQDLGARDFTINAMAVRVGPGRQGLPRLLDPHDGVADLERRLIRVVSSRSLQDDPLRMLRAVRYCAVLDGFGLEAETEAAIRAAAGTISVAAAERVQSEWAALLAAPGWQAAARVAHDLGIGEQTLGVPTAGAAAAAWADFEPRATAELTLDELAVLRLAALLCGPPPIDRETAREILVHRRWPRRTAQQASGIAGWAATVVRGPADTVAWALDDRCGAERAALLARALVAAEAGSGGEAADRIADLERHAARAAEEPWLDGSDLRAWGLSQGPVIGELLREVARGQIERRWDGPQAARAWARGRAAADDAGTVG